MSRTNPCQGQCGSVGLDPRSDGSGPTLPGNSKAVKDDHWIADLSKAYDEKVRLRPTKRGARASQKQPIRTSPKPALSSPLWLTLAPRGLFPSAADMVGGRQGRSIPPAREAWPA